MIKKNINQKNENQIKLKKLNALKSTQITIKLMRIKIELNINKRTQLSFEKSGANPKVHREKWEERRNKIHSPNHCESHYTRHFVNYVITRCFRRHNSWSFFNVGCRCTHQSFFIFYLLKDWVTPHSNWAWQKKNHYKNTKKPLTVSLWIYPFKGNLVF